MTFLVKKIKFKRYFSNSRGYVDLIMHTNKLKKLKNSGGRIGGLL